MDYLEGLNEEQQEAVETTEGYVRVVAGAGSGKTKALAHRFAFLVEEIGVSSANILCVTFTNKAAEEMKRRIRSMIGENDTGFVCTFHGFAVKMLREDIHYIGYPKNFMIMDEDDQDAILKTVYEEAGIDSRKYTYTMAKDKICYRKSNNFDMFDDNYIKFIVDNSNEDILRFYKESEDIEDRIFYGYLYEQKKAYGLDFDDLLIFAYYIMKMFEESREKWQKRFQYIMVDEFQDVSKLEYCTATLLAKKHKNLFIVGDPDQTIYTWRGARVEYFLNFDKSFPKCKTIIMDKNYRSVGDILNVANSLIAKNKQRIDKKLIPMKSGKTEVIYNHSKSVAEEAAWIVSCIEEIADRRDRFEEVPEVDIEKAVGAVPDTVLEEEIDTTSETCREAVFDTTVYDIKQRDYSNIAILYRSHFVSRSIEEELLRKKIPYVILSGVSFYGRVEIKDALCYLRMVAFGDDLSFRRVVNVPRRNFGRKRMALLEEYSQKCRCTLFEAATALLYRENPNPLLLSSKLGEFIELIEGYRLAMEKGATPTDIFQGIISDCGYEAMLRDSGDDEALDNLAELKQGIFEFEKKSGEDVNLEGYLQEVSLLTNMDKEEKKKSVKLMTIHTAKGLEFPFVFVAGMNEGIFPSSHAVTRENMEEERRLAYVAFTRAKDELRISDAEGVNFDGGFRYPSRFILEIDKNLIKYNVDLEPDLVAAAKLNVKFDESENEYNAVREDLLPIGQRVSHRIFGEGVIEDYDLEASSYVVLFDGMETERNIRIGAKLTCIE